MSLKRRSYEAGHKPKFLVIIDESPECDRAVYYASRRAARTGASVVMLLVIEPHDRHQQWLGVADIMKAEAHEAASQSLDEFAARANGVADCPAAPSWKAARSKCATRRKPRSPRSPNGCSRFRGWAACSSARTSLPSRKPAPNGPSSSPRSLA